MRWTFDSACGAFYFEIAPLPSVRQRDLGDGVIVDYASSGQAIGVEVLGNPPNAEHLMTAGLDRAVAEVVVGTAIPLARMVRPASTPPPDLEELGADLPIEVGELVPG
jgi:uncharacterized protein YuzE